MGSKPSLARGQQAQTLAVCSSSTHLRRKALGLTADRAGLQGIVRHLEAAAALGQVGVAVDPRQAVHVHAKPAWGQRAS
jgi:hypothetical protein